MAFFKKLQQPVNKKWYPRSILVGTPISTEEVSETLAAESTVSPADVLAVLRALSGVMGKYMAQGRSVRLDGIGTFYFTANAEGNGVATPEEVSVKQIKGVKVRFLPETSYVRTGTNGRVATRALTDVRVDWIDLDHLAADASKDGVTDPEAPGTDEKPGTGSGGDGGLTE